MPYPKPDDPDYCKGSRTEIRDYDDNKIWFRCPECGRLIAPMGKTRRFFDHVNNKKRARRGDAVQEGLTSHGLNRKEEFGPRVFEPTFGPSEIRSV